ncbi:hypothetical protein JNB63_19965 [Microbacterium trichothecenolyticum]|uniref:DUF4365 domain-containing protein n=1 Tax=Microbacterium ureisolvens TaxID=2781186 RepID=A0ABS7I2T8_9MICO|nr:MULTISPECIES: hypothetical protein [Microbacterium]MBW9111957.1 hypothetical protein [Microbacterium ureisolvens]MBW9122374.1 hypothetical protein [Microbacterium trichothecenolyticum]
MSVELLAVNAVSDRIAACPRLSPEIATGDKTPVTDGHVDFYDSEKQSKKTLGGRVPVQVKGRVTKTRIKQSRESQSFQVERDVLRFFRNHGGGIYFYVPMREGGAQREIFYAILLPFKIDRLLNGGTEAQKTFSIKLTRFPTEPQRIEGIVHLAWQGRSQSSSAGGNAHLLEQAESLTVHSLVGFDESRPTRLALAETDYVVVARLPGGIEIALDLDLDVFPHDYIERELAVPIRCGAVEFTNGTGRRVDENSLVLRLSDGLDLRLTVIDELVSAALNLTREGSFRSQAKNLDFVLAAAAGNPLVVGDRSHRPHAGDPKLETELRAVRAEVAHLIELFDELAISDDLTASLEIDDRTSRVLLALHEGIVQDRAVQGTSDGTGRFDISLGSHKVMVIVLPAEDDNHRRIIDPFDPAKRDRFRIYQLDDNGSPEPTELGTVYESVTPEEMASVLNLRLRNIVGTYAVLDDRAAARGKANLMVLRLLSAADLASDPGHRDELIQGAADLCDWLRSEEPDSLVHRINSWQVRYRLAALDDADRREIRSARRSLRREEAQAALLEVCLLILLEDYEELDLVLQELDDDEVAVLKSWPVWALTRRRPEARVGAARLGVV